MKLIKLLAVAIAATTALAAQAQVPIGPFLSPIQERFDTTAPGAYVAFPGYAGVGGFYRIGTAGLLAVVNAPGLLPPVSPPNAMFGRGVDVGIRFQNLFRLFGGRFRVPFAGIPVTLARFDFYQGALLVGSVIVPVNNAGYLWYGWDLTTLGGFDRVEIFGNGGLPGYVGMDNMVVM